MELFEKRGLHLGPGAHVSDEKLKRRIRMHRRGAGDFYATSAQGTHVYATGYATGTQQALRESA